LQTLQEFKFRDLVASHPSESAFEAAKKMEDMHVGCVIVMEPGSDKILGIATRYDFIHHLIVGEKNPKRTKIDEIMHLSPVVIDGGATTSEALRTMINKRVERLVVTQSGKVLGVLSLEDIVAALEATNVLHSLSKERAQQLRDMIKRLTPYLVARYQGDEKVELQRDMNDEAKALLRLLEEAEVSLR
jgi:signal-transduction protein with cAMP-binding, CBS, and nucleotidyltransferase domain